MCHIRSTAASRVTSPREGMLCRHVKCDPNMLSGEMSFKENLFFSRGLNAPAVIPSVLQTCSNRQRVPAPFQRKTCQQRVPGIYGHAIETSIQHPWGQWKVSGTAAVSMSRLFEHLRWVRPSISGMGDPAETPNPQEFC